jgi:hypothetical protein
MQYHRQALGIISLSAFVVILFIVFFFACFYLLEDAVSYLVTDISAHNILTYR